jgi:hypothetical protein
VPILLPKSVALDGNDAVPAPNGLAPRLPGVPTLQSAFRATQLAINTALKQLAIPAGFEPATLCLEELRRLTNPLKTSGVQFAMSE